MSLIEKAEETIDKKTAMESLEKLQSDTFTLEDFRQQLVQVRKLGALDQIMSMLPSIGPFKDLQKVKVDEKGAQPNRGDHQLDDSKGTPEPSGHQREAVENGLQREAARPFRR